MHHFHSKRTPLKLRIGGIALILKFLCGAAALPFFLMGLLLVRHDLLVITLGLLIAGAVFSLLHFAISREVRCPLCKGGLLRTQGCAYHPKARKFFGSRRLGVVVPALLRGRFRCPYCGEICSCTPRTKRDISSRKRSSKIAKFGISLLLFSFIPQESPAAVSVSLKRLTIASSFTTPSSEINNLRETEILIADIGLNVPDLAETPENEVEWTLPLLEVSRFALLPTPWLIMANLTTAEDLGISPLAINSSAVPEPRAYFLFLLGLLLIFLHRNKPHPPSAKKLNR
jgi:hypothetical protein